LRFGFMEEPNVMDALRPALALPPLGPVDPDEITYYFRRETVIPTERVAGMAVRREALFAMLHLNANRAAAYYGVPTAKVVEIGIEVEI
ncbi:MAG TPA: potassium transporter Kup, partial [Acetobacteraceae bacterium]|nr:potassium transporter Kup [Acetobacteraceae bacterium]